MNDERIQELFLKLNAASAERQYLVASTLDVFSEDELATLAPGDLAINSVMRAKEKGKLDQFEGLVEAGSDG